MQNYAPQLFLIVMLSASPAHAADANADTDFYFVCARESRFTAYIQGDVKVTTITDFLGDEKTKEGFLVECMNDMYDFDLPSTADGSGKTFGQFIPDQSIIRTNEKEDPLRKYDTKEVVEKVLSCMDMKGSVYPTCKEDFHVFVKNTKGIDQELSYEDFSKQNLHLVSKNDFQDQDDVLAKKAFLQLKSQERRWSTYLGYLALLCGVLYVIKLVFFPSPTTSDPQGRNVTPARKGNTPAPKRKEVSA